MGRILNEKDFINQNVELFTERMESSVTRFLDRTPSYVIYYRINNQVSTADSGFENVERMIGKNSPVRYSEVKDFPIYGIEQIVPELNLDEEGMDASFDNGEGILLPNTFIPVPGDFFTIDYLEKSILFQVTEVRYDTIKSNNFYRITFSLKSVNPETISNLRQQVVDRFTTLQSEKGTETIQIIKDDKLALMDELKEVYADIQRSYMEIFYNKKYNVIMKDDAPDAKYYDPYMNNFINTHGLLSSKGDYSTIYLLIERMEKMSDFIKGYRKSVYRALEEKDSKYLRNTEWTPLPVTLSDSIFKMYRDRIVRKVSFIEPMDVDNVTNAETKYYLRPSLLKYLIKPKEPPVPEVWDVVTKEPPKVELPPPPPVEEEEPTGEIVYSRPSVDAAKEEIVFDPNFNWFPEDMDVVEEENPHKDLVVNENDHYEPITGIPPEPLPDVPVPEKKEERVEYDTVVEEYLVNYIHDVPRTVDHLYLEDLHNYAIDMDDSWTCFVETPLLLYVLDKTINLTLH